MTSFVQSSVTEVDPRILNLQRTSDFQAALLGIAGHDLRQPLQVIRLTYDWLAKCVNTDSCQTRLKRGETAIATLTEQLDRLVGALRLYEYAKTMETSSVELAPLFWRLRNENEDKALQHGIDLRVCLTKASVVSHPLLLHSILCPLSGAKRKTSARCEYFAF
jgi:two-component system, OmpR family, phosphate regulon sensor histidine kinase PhoR